MSRSHRRSALVVFHQLSHASGLKYALELLWTYLGVIVPVLREDVVLLRSSIHGPVAAVG